MPEISPTALILLIFAVLGLGALAVILYLKGFLYVRRDGPGLSSGKHNFKTVFGHKVYFTQEGKGDHILLIHGIGASHYVWRYLSPELAKNFTVTAVDLLGFGLSDKPETFTYDLDSQCEVLLELMNQLGITKTIVIGSSMGGTIALRLTQLRPDLITKVVVLSPAADPRITFFDLNKLAFLSSVVRPLVTERLIKQIMNRVYSERKNISDETIRIYLEPYSNNKNAIDSFIKSFKLLRDPKVFEQLDAIKHPVLIMWGLRDKIIPIKFAKKIQSKIPNSILETHPTAGHHIQEDDPEWLIEKVLEFFRV